MIVFSRYVKLKESVLHSYSLRSSMCNPRKNKKEVEETRKRRDSYAVKAVTTGSVELQNLK